jgi:hypothetical protein
MAASGFLENRYQQRNPRWRSTRRKGNAMQVMPAIVLLSASVLLGLFLGLQYLRRVRSKPTLIGVHLILGAAGLEATAVLLRGTPDGTVMPAGSLGNAAALLLATAMISGLASPMIGRRSSRAVGTTALAAHAGVAAGGFVLFLAWITKL